jgi:hypothetical protein
VSQLKAVRAVPYILFPMLPHYLQEIAGREGDYPACRLAPPLAVLGLRCTGPVAAAEKHRDRINVTAVVDSIAETQVDPYQYS